MANLTIKRATHPIRSFLVWWIVQDEQGNTIAQGGCKDGLSIQMSIKYGGYSKFTLTEVSA